MPTAIRLDGREVPLVAYDHGGSGTPVLLLHGGGGNARQWDELAPLLTARHRVAAMDLRCHGESGEGEWCWPSVLDDVDAVVERLGLDDGGTPPAVVGHSFGGMVGARWAIRHPDCPALVDLDGHRSVEADERHYPGMDPVERTAALARLREFFDRMATDLPDRLNALRYVPDFRDAIGSFGGVACPFLVVLATRDVPGTPQDLTELMAAHRRGVRRDLDALAGHRPNVTVTAIDASHGMVAERPREVADLILGFLAG